MNRIAKHSFDGVLAEKFEKKRGFHLLQELVLIDRLQLIESFQIIQSLAVNFAWSGFPLITEFRWRLLKGALGVTESVLPIRACKLPIDINGDPGFRRSRARVVTGKNTGRRRGNGEGLQLTKKAQGNTQAFALPGEQRALSVQRINKHATEAVRR